MQYRDYQDDLFEQLIVSCSNDLAQLDTGGGKTPIEARLAAYYPHTLLVAHRNILIQQISKHLAAAGLEHDTISTEHTRRRCMATHRRYQRNYIRRGHQARRVASIASLISAFKHGRLGIDRWLPWVIIIDEAHHVVPGNQWGMLRELFPNARIIGFTATPARMDGQSLHVDKGGLFDRLIQASMLKENSVHILIERGFLSRFRVYGSSHADLQSPTVRRMMEDPEFSASMEAFWGSTFAAAQTYTRQRSVKPLDWETGILKIFGDPVIEYKRRADGLPAIMMCPAIKNAEEFAELFRSEGIPAACINSTQSPSEIARILDEFECGRIKVLTNVDMVGEGFDLPACKCLIIASRTASFPRYRQWVGRVLRPDEQEAIIIDHTGMCSAHGLPDEAVDWDLLNPPCGPQSIKTVRCPHCQLHYVFTQEHCPECGTINPLLDRPEGFNAGTYYFDIQKLDRELVSIVRGEYRQKLASERLRTELIAPPTFGGDMVGRTMSALAAWFPERLKAGGVPLIDINEFLASPTAKDRAFWMQNFTAKDLTSSSSAKAKKVFKAWQKSHSSTAMPQTITAKAI